MLVLGGLGLAACGPAGNPDPRGTTNAVPAAPTTYAVKGVIKELLPNGRTARITHEAIPGYMEAMTMPLDVKDTNELKGLQAGDQVAFRMVVTPTDGWIDQVRKIGEPTNLVALASATNGPPPRGTLRPVPQVEPLAVGDPIPDYKFTNQFGQPLSLHQYRGQVLAFTFIFTRCPFPTFCPRMNLNFEQAQRLLKKTPNAPTNWHFLSLSFDPEFDTPAVLKSYAERVNYDPRQWTFATSDLWTIDGITEQFGLQFWREGSDLPNHNLRTVVLDPRGRIHQVFNGQEWQPAELVDSMLAAAKANGAP